jgi:FMN-dependent NADH-azoreductase
MSKTLFVNACVREHSRTLELAGHVLAQIGGEVEEIKLYEANLSPLDNVGMQARAEAFRAKDFSDSRFDLARQFASSETIVIAAPYWDLMFPAVLKVYFETVTVNGLTFVYGENGTPIGLCKAKRLIYVTTAGGPIVKNFGYDYTYALATAFYGIQDVICIRAEKLDIRGADVDNILRQAKDSIAL